jgi:hypothetical protein
MAPRALTMVFAATVIAIVVVFALWVFPGYLSSTCPVRTTMGGHAYCAESVTIFGPVPCFGGRECSHYQPSFSFLGVEFQLTLGNESGSDWVSGSVTEPNNTTYEVHLLGDSLGPPSVTWTSADQAVFVEWWAPFGSLGSGGSLQTNVTCGVSFTLIT